MDAGFFKGTSLEQDRRFSDKESRLLKSMKFDPVFEQRVDMRKVNLGVMRPWITKKVVDLVGFEDEVVVEYAMELLEDKSNPTPDPKVMQINLTGFLEQKTPAFMKALWELLLSAQESIGGVPAQFVNEKKAELRQQQERDARAINNAQQRAVNAQRMDEIRTREKGEREAARGRGRGRGDYGGRDRDSGWPNRGRGGRAPDNDRVRYQCCYLFDWSKSVTGPSPSFASPKETFAISQKVFTFSKKTFALATPQGTFSISKKTPAISKRAHPISKKTLSGSKKTFSIS
ncbi:PWI domain-containing protein [Cantharellus anzutake]|uniref:PWI domain-containing protein n=1 Tax=Cantharellus anzutake TaxID=1750568 RepID=UPI0019034308|nr:PWI domain-containing protein [Cantharellus anzutake]KAF8342866.1 PWI domain-containing protein [Cantharellus anzutake]